MFITRKHINRRTLLRGAGTALALPLLDAMIPAGTAFKPYQDMDVRHLGEPIPEPVSEIRVADRAAAMPSESPSAERMGGFPAGVISEATMALDSGAPLGPAPTYPPKTEKAAEGSVEQGSAGRESAE